MYEWPDVEKSTYKEDLDRVNVNFETSIGSFSAELYAKECPETVWNFINLAEGRQQTKVKEGRFYDGLLFYRVHRYRQIICGCHENSGYGKPGYRFIDELHSSLKHDKAGIISMVNCGYPGSNGSQFLITLCPAPILDGRHTVFGEVFKGMDVIQRIGYLPLGEFNDRPVNPIILNHVEIVR